LNAVAATVAGLLEDATRRIGQALGLERREARLEARVLAAFAWDVAPAWLVAHDTEAVGDDARACFQALVVRRLHGEPVAHLVGTREFYGRPFRVSADVLIPRPDTEILVEAALQHLPADAPCSVLDLGAGSGAIAVTLALERPHARVVAVERSPAALDTARANAQLLGARNVACVAGDWYATTGRQRFDLVVSNPPYIPTGDPHLDRGDLRFEPRQALAAGDDGLQDLRRIISGAPQRLVPGGWLLVEHGYDQGDAVRDLLHAAGFVQVITRQDLAGHDRVSGGEWPGLTG
jgi:release factor glutamine methyltransferase